MDRERVSAVSGVLGLVLLFTGAILLSINSTSSPLAYGLLITGALFFTIFILLNHKAIIVICKKRSSLYGVNMLVMILLFTCIIIIIQAISIRHNHRFDLTRNRRFSLANQTTTILKTLDKDIEIVTFFQKSAEDEKWRAENLINQYASASKHIKQDFIDPDRKPQIAKEMGITRYGTTVVKCGDKKKLLTTLTEETLTNAILQVSREAVKVIYIVQGRGEKDPAFNGFNGFSIMKNALEMENYLVRKLFLVEEESIPEDCSMLLIAGPTTDYFPSEIERIEEYIRRGGDAIFMIDPRTSLPNLENMLARYKIKLDNNIIIDPTSRDFGSDKNVPAVMLYDQHHPITKGFNLITFFPITRSVTILDDGLDEDITIQYLAKTSAKAWGETDFEMYSKGTAIRDEADIFGPLPIAVIASRAIQAPDSISKGDKKSESKIVVFGDSDFASNNAFRISGNADFLLNTINFLAEEENLISIRPKSGMGDQIFLTASQGRLIFLLSIVIPPLTVISIGTTIFMRRRKNG